LIGQPAEGRDQPARCLGSGGPRLDDLMDPFRRATLEGEHSGREDFARLADLDERRSGDLPAGRVGDTKTVDVCLDTVVEAGKIGRHVVRAETAASRRSQRNADSSAW